MSHARQLHNGATTVAKPRRKQRSSILCLTHANWAKSWFVMAALLAATTPFLLMPTRVAALELPLQGVVRIEAQSGNKSRKGSGFVVRVGTEGAYIVTAAHVVEGVKRPRVALASNPNVWVQAETLRREWEQEDGLAVVLSPPAIGGQPIGKLPLADSAPAPGDDVTIIGFPRVVGGLSVLPGRTTQRGRNLVFSQGLGEGFSGSPMLVDGRVAGVVTRTTEENGIGVTVNALTDFLKGAGVTLTPDLSIAFMRQWGREGEGHGQFLRPWGIAAAWSVDRVYVSDSFRGNVQVFSRNGRFLDRLPAQIMGSFIAVDSNGQVYALNYDPGTGRNERIELYGYGDHQLRKSIPMQGQSPRAIDTDIYGHEIFVTDITNQNVWRYDEHGQVTASWGSAGRGPGQFHDPWGIAVDRYRTKRVYVADTGNDRVQAFTRDGQFITSWGEKGTSDGQFDSPIDVAVDTSHGYVFVLDRKSARVQVFTPDGEFLGKWGSPGSGEGEFRDPYGIAIDGNDTIYVLDTGNRRVQVFQATWR